MEAFKEYLVQNLALLLVLVAFAIILRITVFLDKKLVRRTYVLIVATFVLSVIVFTEFYLERFEGYRLARTILMAIRYSATPLIAAQLVYALAKNLRFFIFIPAGALLVLDIVSIFTPIVFGLDENGQLVRGPLGFLPYIVAGLYLAVLIFILFKRSNRRAVEIIPIVFLAGSFVLGLILPFFLGKEFSALFCTIIGISLFVYFVFQILDLSKKDPLTGLLNRQAYNAEIEMSRKDITAIVSADMNGLKTINDNEGHAAGDEALITLSQCLRKACRRKQMVYRIGGDEFVIVCRRSDRGEVEALIERAGNNTRQTKYSCSFGYGYDETGERPIQEMLEESDAMLYKDKARHYSEQGGKRG